MDEMAIKHRKAFEIISELIEINHSPLSDWSNRYPGRRAMGYICTYVPDEIIYAAGFIPVRIRSSSQPTSLADSYLQSFTCHLSRSCLDQALRGELDFLEGMVFPHTCDTLQHLAEIWKQQFPAIYLETLSQPTSLSSPCAKLFLITELKRFLNSLEDFIGHSIEDEDLNSAIEIYNKKRWLLSILYGLRGRLSNVQFFSVVWAGFLMPVEEYNSLLSELVQSLEKRGTPNPSGPRLILAGSLLDDLTVPAILDEMDAIVVGDDLCTGSRYFDKLTTGGFDLDFKSTKLSQKAIPFVRPWRDHLCDTISAIADRYIERIPCPAKYKPSFRREEHLLTLVEKKGADGVVFVLQKFCDPHAFDYVLVKEKFEERGIPLFLLDIGGDLAIGQLRTRLQAFLEMISGH
jgi:benzoyl-CoA reductase/2-hydroxyglutaryl-CoA dehydratase subunit BcrC/BadD/HgdB